MYLKDHSPYLDSSLPYSKSQNIIRVNLLGNHSTSYYLVLIKAQSKEQNLLVASEREFQDED